MLLLLALMALLACATAFDMGHHSDLIENALTLRNYSQAAISIATNFAWLVDYHST